MAKCKANPAVCLRGIEIGGIDLVNKKNLLTQKLTFCYHFENF